MMRILNYALRRFRIVQINKLIFTIRKVEGMNETKQRMFNVPLFFKRAIKIP